MKRALLIVALAAIGGAAHAEQAPVLYSMLPHDGAQSPTAALMDAARARPSATPLYAEANVLRAAGIARTSIDKTFASDSATLAAGFICGLQPGVEKNGGAGAFGYDPHGRFIGAKFSLAFH
jgi:hypothetical protein